MGCIGWFTNADDPGTCEGVQPLAKSLDVSIVAGNSAGEGSGE
jgi:hypothetical protein